VHGDALRTCGDVELRHSFWGVVRLSCVPSLLLVPLFVLFYI
jgi:hypothetical protein